MISPDNNIEAVFSYLKSQKIHLNKNNLSFQVKSHANFPSLLSFSDTLHFLGIPNIAFNLSFEDLEKLPDSFLAFLGNKDQQQGLFHITRQGNYYVYKKEKKSVKATVTDLAELWKNVVLLAEKPDEEATGSKSKVPAVYLLSFLGIIVLGMVYLFSHSYFTFLFGLLSISGLFLSLEALKTELGIESEVSRRFCGMVANADCGQVINSVKEKWQEKIKISDISIWFFASQLFALFVFSVAGYTQAFISGSVVSLLLSVPMTVYSIYFQYKVEKKWCLICLAIIGVVYIELASLLFSEINLTFDLRLLGLFFIIYLMVAVLVYLIKPVFAEKKDLENNYIKQLRFSRDYQIFRNTLVSSDIRFFEKEYIVLGNLDSKHRISMVTSLTCEFCMSAHLVLDNIYKQHGQNLAISIRFNFYDSLSTETKKLYLKLGEIYEEKTESDFMFALKSWFENKNLEAWFKTFGTPENPAIVKSRLTEITAENLEKGLNFTPNIFLNQYNFPTQYDIENLENFVGDWIEDEAL